jgi:hypothetical protein
MRAEDLDFVLVGLHFYDRPCGGHVCGDYHITLSGDGERAVHREILSRKEKDWERGEIVSTRVHLRDDRTPAHAARSISG